MITGRYCGAGGPARTLPSWAAGSGRQPRYGPGCRAGLMAVQIPDRAEPRVPFAGSCGRPDVRSVRAVGSESPTGEELARDLCSSSEDHFLEMIAVAVCSKNEDKFGRNLTVDDFECG